jgi:hypothetical protein
VALQLAHLESALLLSLCLISLDPYLIIQFYVLDKFISNITHQLKLISKIHNFISYLLIYFVFFKIFFIILSGVRLSPCGTEATSGLLYQPQMTYDGDCRATGGMRICRGNRSTRRKSTRVTLSTTKPTWPDPGSNPGHRGEKPATNHLSYGAALSKPLKLCMNWRHNVFHTAFHEIWVIYAQALAMFWTPW